MTFSDLTARVCQESVKFSSSMREGINNSLLGGGRDSKEREMKYVIKNSL